MTGQKKLLMALPNVGVDHQMDTMLDPKTVAQYFIII